MLILRNSTFWAEQESTEAQLNGKNGCFSGKMTNPLAHVISNRSIGLKFQHSAVLRGIPAADLNPQKGVFSRFHLESAAFVSHINQRPPNQRVAASRVFSSLAGCCIRKAFGLPLQPKYIDAPGTRVLWTSSAFPHET